MVQLVRFSKLGLGFRVSVFGSRLSGLGFGFDPGRRHSAHTLQIPHTKCAVPSLLRTRAPGFRVSGFGFRVSGFRFRVSGFEFRVSGFGSKVQKFGFRVRVLGFRFRVEGLECVGLHARRDGFRVPGFGFPVSVFRFRLSVFGSRCSDFEFRASCLGFQASGFEIRLSDLGSQVSGFESWECRSTLRGFRGTRPSRKYARAGKGGFRLWVTGHKSSVG